MQKRSLLRRSPIIVALVASLGVAPLAHASGWGGGGESTATRRPILFVHGGAGSGAQFESQAQRFAVNGYPSSLVHVFEYDSQFGVETFEEVQQRLDATIDVLRQATGSAQIDLIGHSLGTRVGQTYLTAGPEHASRVAHWVNIDGYPATALPGEVPTLAVWAGVGAPGRSVAGATNVTIPDQTHVQAATSAETFAQIYQFFTGSAPRTTSIEATSEVQIAGRATIFPQNVGVEPKSAVAVFQIDPVTGQRTSNEPLATAQLTASGRFGPFKVRGDAHHELVVFRPSAPPHHFFYEPFVRDDHLLRLNLSRPGEGLDAKVAKGPNHVALTVVRFKEFWGDQGAQNDALQIGDTNVINAKTSPRANRTVSVYAFDERSDGQSDLSIPLPTIYGTPFLTGVDLYVPSWRTENADPAVDILVTPRGNEGQKRGFAVPALPSSEARITVQLHDYE
ncbi:MAG: alpha/beta fold hydrolase [Polyangiales bacterium]